MRDWKRWLVENLDLPGLPGGREHRILEELANHLEELYQEARSRGMSETEAEVRVLEWLGDPKVAARELLQASPGRARSLMNRWAEEREEILRRRGGTWASLADALRDLRSAARGLLRAPVFTAVVVLVLALGIGATTAIFTLVDSVILSPLPFPEPDRLVAVQHAAPGRGLADAGQCAAFHFTYLDESSVFEELGMFSDYSSGSVTGIGDPEAVSVLEVTSGVFRAIRLTPVVGRIFTELDEDPDGPPTVMLGRAYWLSRFGGDRSVVGRTLEVDGLRREIIGVAPAEVSGLGSNPALILPLRFRRSSLFVGNIGYDAVGRLREGVTLEEARADLARVLPMAWEKFPGGPVASSSSPNHYVAQVLPLKLDLVGSASRLLWVLLGGVAVVLLIACANVANLILVRAETREGEMAVRMALGAGAARVGWEYLKEAILLTLAGGIGGLMLAVVALRSLIAMAPANLPRLDAVSLDLTVVIFTLVVSTSAALFFGLLPAWRYRRKGLAESLKGSGRSGTGGRWQHRTQNLLATGQMALALVLLVASGLLCRSFQNLASVDPGFRDPEDILAVRLYISPSRIRDPAEVALVFETMAGRLRQIPGVESATVATAVPMDGSSNVNPFFVRGEDLDQGRDRPSRRHKWIGGDYLETLKIPLVAGRSITWDDVHARAPVALLSESLALEVFGSPAAAMGRFIAARPDPPEWKEVVGVVADVREDGMDQPPPLLVYWPQVTLGFWEGNGADQVQTWRNAGIALRTGRVNTPGLVNEVQDAIWSVNPNIPLLQVRSLPDLMAASTARASFVMVLMLLAAGVALVLGLVGVYAVISYGVSQRSGELGMRMALGARTGQVVAMVLRQGLILAGVGVAVGLVLAVGLNGLLESLLFEVSPMDPVVYGMVSGGLILVAALASYAPARRAARVDPMRALRVE